MICYKILTTNTTTTRTIINKLQIANMSCLHLSNGPCLPNTMFADKLNRNYIQHDMSNVTHEQYTLYYSSMVIINTNVTPVPTLV